MKQTLLCTLFLGVCFISKSYCWPLSANSFLPTFRQNDANFTKLFVAVGATARSFNDDSPELLTDVEIVDLIELDHPCVKPRDFPVPMTGAVGAYINGFPTICGGIYEDGQDRCYTYDLGSDNWIQQSYSMQSVRAGASAAINDDGRWVISGGANADEILFTSEELIGNDFVATFDLPIKVTNHALLALPNDAYVLVGGHLDDADVGQTNMWLWNYLGGGDFWAPFSPTNYPHETIMAGAVYRLDGRQEIVITGGTPYLTEIFDMQSLYWRTGPEFPGHLVEGAYVQYANTFLTVGGYDVEGGGETYGNYIYLYDADNEVWIHFSQTLATPRTNAVAFMVPDNFCPGGHEP